MGAPLTFKPGEHGSPFDYLDEASDGVLYVVCRLADRPAEDRRKLPIVHLQGVATSRAMALQMCRDETYFIGPIPKNVLLPHRAIPWVGLEFPLLKEPPPGN